MLQNNSETNKSSICCEVDSCKHNDGNCCCHAQNVTIKNRMALLGDETMCGTYEECE